LKRVVKTGGGEQLGVLMSADAATEDFYLAQKLAKKLGSENFDSRLREQDFGDDGWAAQAASFAAPMSDIDKADSILLVGSNIRQEAPLLGQRVRKAWRAGAKIAAINPVNWNLNFSLTEAVIAAPQNMVTELALLAKAVAGLTKQKLPSAMQSATNDQKVGKQHQAMAAMLAEAENKVLLLGQAGLSHAHAAWLRQLSAWICEATGASLNIVTHGGNATGAAKVRSLTHGGLNARAMLDASLSGYLLWDVEPDFDFANPSLASRVLEDAKKVVAVSTYAGADLKACADVILPLAPLPESEGTFYTFDGQMIEVQAAAKLSGEARPGWKILRRLGAHLELEGFEQVDLASVREEMSAMLENVVIEPLKPKLAVAESFNGLSRVGEVGMYAVNGMCRRSEYLQQTVQAQINFVGLSENDAARLGLSDGQHAKVGQRDDTISLPVRICRELPEGAVWVKAGTPAVSALGDSYGPIRVEAV
jgi:NADH-quinone oxidoreductase subunit G